MLLKTYPFLSNIMIYFMATLNIYFITPVLSDAEYDGPVSAKLFHNLDVGSDPRWGEVALFNFQNVVTGSVFMARQDTSYDSKAKIEDLIANNTLYRIKAVITSLRGKETTFHSFIDARSLLDWKTIKILTLSLDQSGSVMGMSLSATDSASVEHYQEIRILDFSIYLELRPTEQGPIPDTASYIQKIEKEREAKERGATQDNRSFFAKYWMYIVPIVLFAILSGSTNVDSGNNGNR